MFYKINGLSFVLVFFSTTTLAANPPNWPWHGTVVHSICNPSALASGCVDNLPADIDTVAADGANAVLLDLKIAFYMQRNPGTDKGEAIDESINWLDSMLDRCAANGITCIVRNRSFPLEPGQGYTQTSATFWDDPDKLVEAYELLVKLTERLGNRNTELGAYSIIPDPAYKTIGGIIEPPNYKQFVSNLLKIIEDHDQGRHLVVGLGPNAQTKNYTGANPLPHDNLIYAVRFYTPFCFTHQGLGKRPLRDKAYPTTQPLVCAGNNVFDSQLLQNQIQPVIDFSIRNKALIWVDEFGSVRYGRGSDQYISDLIDLFNSIGFSWTYFNGPGSNQGMWSYDTLNINDSVPVWWSQAIIDQWNSSGQGPNGRHTILQTSW